MSADLQKEIRQISIGVRTLALAFLAGAVCIAIFVRNHLIALLSLSAILLVIGVQLILTLSGLYAPLQQTVAGLSGG